MSFSFTIADGPIAEFGDRANTAVTNFKRLLEESDTQPSDEALESVQAAIAAAQTIIASGAVGSGTVSASISGHANPGHVPVQGWANDFVQVSIYCTGEAAPAQPADASSATDSADGAAGEAAAVSGAADDPAARHRA